MKLGAAIALLCAVAPHTFSGATSLLGRSGHVSSAIGGGSRSSGELRLEQDFDHLRKSVVRITAVSGKFDWFQPFAQGTDEVGLGSGFVVQTEPYYLFVTNEHVINDATKVTLQLLLYGEHQWEAQVVASCPKFDLALLVLREPAAFGEAMKKRSIQLEALKLSSAVAAMGADVVALGFPLGQDALKISKGNIAGNEEVDGNICIQSTAPVSPGSSGGPLLNDNGTEVVGVNFAKATEGENINYVIPAWRVRQMINQHHRDQPEIPANHSWKRIYVQVPRPELTTIEANQALYELSGGCTKGVYIAKVGNRSFFRSADPPVTEGSFLVSVNGFELDGFGMGINPEYAADRVSYSDLFFMVPDFAKGATFGSCSDGKIVQHKADMSYLKQYNTGLNYIHEPVVLGYSQAFEMFGGISIMEMTVNHINQVVNMGDPAPARWLHPDFVAQSRLVINYVRSGSYVADILYAGSAVEKLNGHYVHTLDDFRRFFEPAKSKVWTIETDMGQVAALMFNESLTAQLSQAEEQNSAYLLTPTVMGAAKRAGLVSNALCTQDEADDSPSTSMPIVLSAARRYGLLDGDSCDEALLATKTHLASRGASKSKHHTFLEHHPAPQATATIVPRAAGPLLAERAAKVGTHRISGSRTTGRGPSAAVAALLAQ